jgi:4'-phosphopantetheinyl transferase
MRVPAPKFVAPRRMPALRPAEVHLWLADLAVAPGVLSALAATLTPDEAACARGFHLATHRDEWIAARGGLRRLLGHYLGIEAGAVRLVCSASGKPMVAAGRREVRFNLSHSLGRCLYAFTIGREVGVDLQAVQPRRATAGIARRFFAPPEVAALEALPEADRSRRFFDLWTRKEAFVKGIGRGLALGLDRFVVEPGGIGVPTPVVTLDERAGGERWTTVRLAAGRGFAAALAVPGAGWRLRGFRLNFDRF